MKQRIKRIIHERIISRRAIKLLMTFQVVSLEANDDRVSRFHSANKITKLQRFLFFLVTLLDNLSSLEIMLHHAPGHPYLLLRSDFK